MEALQEELEKREAILQEREQMVKDKSGLEMKKLRSSQVLSKVRKLYLHWIALSILNCSS
jgi:hypothetical protein